MREAINEVNLDEITGGKVNLNKSRMRIGFTTLGQGFDLKCSYEEARDLLVTLFAPNDTTEAKFDQLVKDEFYSRGWI